MTMKLRNAPFPPPDMTEEKASEVSDAIMSGWITRLWRRLSLLKPRR